MVNTDFNYICVVMRSLKGAYNGKRYLRNIFAKKLGKKPADTFAVYIGRKICVFDGDIMYEIIKKQNIF